MPDLNEIEKKTIRRKQKSGQQILDRFIEKNINNLLKTERGAVWEESGNIMFYKLTDS